MGAAKDGSLRQFIDGTQAERIGWRQINIFRRPGRARREQPIRRLLAEFVKK